MANPKPPLTVPEVAALAGVERQSVHQAIAAKTLVATSYGGGGGTRLSWLVQHADAMAWAKAVKKRKALRAK